MEKLIEKMPILIFFAAIASAWWFLRSGGTKFDSTADFDKRLGNGRPLVLEFFSNG